MDDKDINNLENNINENPNEESKSKEKIDDKYEKLEETQVDIKNEDIQKEEVLNKPKENVVRTDILEHNQNSSKKKKKKRSSKVFSIIAGGIFVSLIGGIIGSALTYYALRLDGKVNNTLGNNKNDVVRTESISSEDLSVTEAIQKVAPAVVIVSTKSTSYYNGIIPQETEGIGSGFIINEEGYILTNYHVIENASEVSIMLSDGNEATAKVVNYDKNQDIAMLKINEQVKIPGIAELGDSEQLLQGETVLAIGTPLSKDFASTVTKGIVSSTHRELEVEQGKSLNLIQIDAAINPGNSGGPLINLNGQVVGINTVKITSGENMGFAIPINDISDRIESLSKPILNLGIKVRVIDQALSKELNLEEGLYVAEVIEFSAAEKGGLKIGDIITHVDGKRIKTMEELQAIKDKKNNGDSLKVTVNRDESVKSLTVVLKE